MANFFLDNKDIQLHFKNMDLSRITQLIEMDYTDKDKFDYAPEDYEDAKDNYYRVLDILGEICAETIAPNAADVDENGCKLENNEVHYAEKTEENLRLLRQSQMMGFTLPREYGGLNCPMSIYSIAIEMVSQADASLMNLFGLQDIGETINEFASEELKAKYLPMFANGDVTGAMALTEPDAGSDLQAVQLKADYSEKDNCWYLNGVKRFITNGNAEVSLVLARSEAGSKDARGLSMFIYERDENLVIRRIENKLGIHGSPTCELQYNNCKAYLVGKRKRGLSKYVMALMNGARLGVAAQALGVAQAAYNEALMYAKDREQFGTKIIEFPAVWEMLSNMKLKVEAGRALLYETSKIVDMKRGLTLKIEHNPKIDREVKTAAKKYDRLAAVFTPLCKYYLTEISNQVAYDALQVHGGTGYMKEFPIERLYRDARITNIYEGTSQLQVVAAIGAILNGFIFEKINEYMTEFEENKALGKYIDTLSKAKTKIEMAVNILKDKGCQQTTDYYAKTLVEMTLELIVTILMLRTSSFSKDKLIGAEKMLNDLLPLIEMKYSLIANHNDNFLKNFEIE